MANQPTSPPSQPPAANTAIVEAPLPSTPKPDAAHTPHPARRPLARKGMYWGRTRDYSATNEEVIVPGVHLVVPLGLVRGGVFAARRYLSAGAAQLSSTARSVSRRAVCIQRVGSAQNLFCSTAPRAGVPLTCLSCLSSAPHRWHSTYSHRGVIDRTARGTIEPTRGVGS